MILNLPKLGPVQFDDNLTPAQFNDQLTQLSKKYGFELTEPELTTGEMASRAFTRGTKQLGSAFGDVIPAMVAKGLGFDEYAKEQMQEAAETQEEIQKYYKPQYPNLESVKSPFDVPGFALETIIEQAPNIVTSLIPGVGFEVVAARTAATAMGKQLAIQAAERGLAGEAATAFVKQGLTEAAPQIAAKAGTAQTAGVYLGSYAQNAPEIFQNIYDKTGQMDVGAALLFGSASAALDSILPASLARQITGPARVGLVEKVLEKSGMDRGLLRSVTSNVVKNFGLEGLTEGAQEAISISAENFVANNPQVFDSDDWKRIMESTVRGAIAGGGFGAVGGTVEGIKAKAEEARRKADELAEQNRKAEADRLRQQADELEAMAEKQAQMELPGIEREGLAAGLTSDPKFVAAKAAVDARRTLAGIEEEPVEKIKELVGKQFEMFTPEGGLSKEAEKAATADQKRAAAKARQDAIEAAAQQATALKETQAKLRSFLSSKQATLPGFSPAEIKAADEQRAALQAQAVQTGQGDLFAGMPPAPAPKPPDTLIGTDKDSLRSFGKQFGIGPTAAILKENGPLAGKDIANPQDAVEVKRVLEAYASGKPAAGASEKIADYLKRPEFTALEGAPDERISGEAIPAGGEPSVPMPDRTEADIGAAPAVAQPEATGMEPTGEPVAGAGVGAKPSVAAVETTDAVWKSKDFDFPVKVVNEAPVTKDGVPYSKVIYQEKETFVPTEQLSGYTPPPAAEPTKRGRPKAVLTPEEQVAKEEARRAAQGASRDATRSAERLLKAVSTPLDETQYTAETLPEAQQEQDARTISAVAQAYQIANDPAFKNNKPGQIAQQVINHPSVTQRQREIAQARVERMPKPARAEAIGKEDPSRFEIRKKESFRGRTTGDVEFELYRDGKFVQSFSRRKDAQQMLDIFTLPDEQVYAKYPELKPAKSSVIELREDPYTGEVKPYPKEEAAYDEAFLDFTDAQSALNYIAKESGTRFQRLLAARLAPILKGVRVDVVYDPRDIVDPTVRAEFEKGNPNGVYYKKIIYLDARTGLNNETVLHEAIHAATVDTIHRFLQGKGGRSNAYQFLALATATQKNAKKYYDEMLARADKDPQYALLHGDIIFTMRQLADPDGVDIFNKANVDEFFSYGLSNKQMQEFLMMAPGGFKEKTGGSLFTRFVNAIRNLFGFGPEHSSAFQDLVIITDQVVKPVPVSEDGITPKRAENLARNTLSEIGRIGQNMPKLTLDAAEGVKNMLSNAPSNLIEMGTGILRLDNINAIYGKQLPSIQKLLDALEKRNGMQEQRIKRVNDNYKHFTRVTKSEPQAVERMNDMAYDARLAQVDILDPNFKPTPAQAPEYNRLKNIYNSLPKDVQEIYRTIRGEYDAVIKEYENILFGNTETGEPGVLEPSVAKKLRGQYEARKRQIAYIPFLRRGDFWVEYTGEDGERYAHAFQSIRERQLFIQNELQGKEHKTFQRLENGNFKRSDIPPTSFIGQVIANLNKQGASEQQVNEVYQAYLALFPAESLAKRFMKADNVRGMERDIIRGYGDTMIKWARKLAASKYLPQVDNAVSEIQAQAENVNDPQVDAVAKNILAQQDFFRNPTYNNLVSRLTAFSYFEYIAGNVSSAIVNLSTLPLFSWPILGGRFGFPEASSALLRASRIAIDGMEKHPRYKNLYRELMDHAQLEHTVSREVLEGRRETTGEFLGVKARIMDALSIPFSATERLNRGATAVAAYDLARNSGMNEKDAIRFALTTVKDINTSGISATAPRWMQTWLGRIFFTFKSFTFNSAFVIARTFHQAFKGESPEIQRIARRQLLGVYGMTMAFAGIKGMPFMGAVNTLAEMIAALFGDDEPFDVNTEMREFFGELPYKGLLNYTLNLEIANRTGIAQDLLFRDDPQGVAENGLVLTALKQAFGPTGSYLFGAERGLRTMAEGQTMRGIEALVPSFIRNGMKAARFMREGALTLKGEPIDTDINTWNLAMQAIGFAPADLSETYERVSAAKSYERQVENERNNILKLFTMARKTGDSDLRAEAKERQNKFNSSYPKLRITEETLARSARAAKAAEKNLLYGVKFNPKLRPEIEEKFFDDEE